MKIRLPERITMSNNATTKPPYSSFVGLCSFDGVARDHSSAFNAVKFLISLIIALMSPIAVTGNALILMTIWTNPSLRTASSIILCGLAFTDFCTGLVTQPFFVAAEMICLKKPQEIGDSLLFLVIAKIIAEVCGTYLIALTVLVMTFMSTERWLHMSARRSLVTSRRVRFTLTGLFLLPVPAPIFRSFQLLEGKHGLVLNIISFAVLFLCLFATSTAYFKVFRIIRHHQQQVRTSEPSQNFGQPAIDLAKYKKSVLSILHIVLLFYLSYLPFLVFLGVHSSFQNHSQVDLAFLVANLFFFVSSSVNPFIYLCRMTDIRNGVRQLLKKLCC